LLAVIDTNVVVSAAIKRDGAPALIIRAWQRDAFVWVISQPLLGELQRIFARPNVVRYFAWTPTEVVEFFEALPRSAKLVKTESRLGVIHDEPDNRLLEAAIAGEVEYVVSGDAAVLAIGEFEGVRIVSPARFLAVLQTQGL
jgi:putative PIN family toxin of toxin-antitoxin system